MAFSTPVARGSAVETASDNAISVSPTAALVVGRAIICAVAIKNIATADGASNTVTSVQDSRSHTWTKVDEYTETEAGASDDGSTIAVFFTIVTTQIETTDSVTANLSGNIGDKIISLTEVQRSVGDTIAAVQVGVGQNAIAASVSSLTSKEYYLFGAAAGEGSDNTKTPDADYTERHDTRSRNNAAAITIHVQDRIATLTSDTCTSTGWTATQPIALLVAFEEAFTPVVATPGAGTLSALGLAVALAFTGPAEGTLRFTGHAPTVSVEAGTTIPIGAGALNFTGQAPLRIVDTPVPIGAGSLAFTGQAPAVSAGLAIPIGAGTLSFVGQTPADSEGLNVAIGAGALSFTGRAPTDVEETPGTITVGAGVLNFTGQSVSVAFTGPAEGRVHFTGKTPTVSVETPGAILVPAGALAFTGQAPTAQITRLIAIGAGSLAFTGQYVGIAFLEPSAGSLLFTGQAPTVSIGGSGTTIAIGAGSLALTGKTPTVLTAFNLAIGAGALSFSGKTPEPVGAGAISPPAGRLNLTGQSLTIAWGVGLSQGTLSLTGQAPGLSWVVAIPNGTLALTGKGITLNPFVVSSATVTSTSEHPARTVSASTRRTT